MSSSIPLQINPDQAALVARTPEAFAPEIAGPHNPLPVTPPRPLGSIRRTSTIDTSRPEGSRGALIVDARARDLITRADGSTEVVGRQRLSARLDGPTHAIEWVETDPPEPRLEALVGAVVGPGFRGRMTELLPDLAEAGTLLYLLLDDWPGATLVSGYAGQVEGIVEGDEPHRISIDQMAFQTDICIGWAGDASMMNHIRDEGVNPVVLGAQAPSLDDDPDPLANHEIDAMPPHTMRRRRRIDVWQPSEGHAAFDGHFRDSHQSAESFETIVHEYTVSGTADMQTRLVESISAEARVLPWIECPGSIASAARIQGMALEDLRARVRAELVGTTTCTHLNDTLRALSDVGTLLAELAASD
ncbi:MAG: hypothetical protein JWL73_363 [Actinomycetia bacterium]|nr:hypothetical protein [Actinomycetes bacterium]